MSHRSIAFLAFVPLLCGVVASCAGPYHPANYAGGYSDAQVDRNVFRVTFKGNVAMKQSETDDLALLRAAEVTLDHGYLYFVSSGAAPVGSAMSLATNVVTTPASTITIACFETRPETTAIVYDARHVVADHPR